MKKIRLDTVCEITAGQGAPQGENSYSSEGIPFVKAGDLVNLIAGKKENEIQKVSEEVAKEKKLKLFPAGSVLFAKSGMSCMKGYVYQLKDSAYVVSHLAVIMPRNIDSNFLRYYFTFDKPNKLVQDAAYPAISLKDIASLEIPHPPLLEQQKIAAHLDSIQSAIDNKKQQFQQLDELVKSKFVEMFGDVNLNDKNFDTEIGKNLFKFSSGKFLSAEFRLESGIPVYGGNGIAWYTEKPLIEYSTIIIGRVGAYCGNVKLVTEPVWITDNALFIKEFKTSRFNLQFLIKLMENINFAKYAGKVAQPKITQGPLEEQVYIIPPIELQNTFAEYVQKIDSAKSIIKTQLVDLQELLDSKMDEYFGE